MSLAIVCVWNCVSSSLGSGHRFTSGNNSGKFSKQFLSLSCKQFLAVSSSNNQMRCQNNFGSWTWLLFSRHKEWSKTDILLQTLVLVYLRLTINGSQPIFSPQENDALHGFYIKFSIERHCDWLSLLNEMIMFKVSLTQDNPASFSSSLLTRVLSYCYLVVFNLSMLLCPR